VARYLKQGRAHIAPAADTVQETVRSIIGEVAQRGEAAVRDYSSRLDDWNPPSFRLDAAQVDSLCERVDRALLEHIDFAAGQVRAFAEAQLQTIRSLDVEVGEGRPFGRQVPENADVSTNDARGIASSRPGIGSDLQGGGPYGSRSGCGDQVRPGGIPPMRRSAVMSCASEVEHSKLLRAIDGRGVRSTDSSDSR